MTNLIPTTTANFVDEQFRTSIIPTLEDYIHIPNTSPSYDADGSNAEETAKVVNLFTNWLDNMSGGYLKSCMEYKVICEEGRTPVICIEILDDSMNMDNTVLLYGHLDKQPPFTGWMEGLGPYTPVIRDNRLYGRGGADDGYAMFSAVTAIANIHNQQRALGQPVSHSRFVILIEASEESGSPDLPYYVESLMDSKFLTDVSLIVCLDSGCGDYESAWITTSLRGVLVCDLSVDTLREGIHSGDGSGICVDSFRVLRQLLDRIEDPVTGKCHDSFFVDIPPHRLAETIEQVKYLGNISGDYPIVGLPSTDDQLELALNRSWRPTLTITGQNGLPDLSTAGNVLRPGTSIRLSMRLPPTLCPKKALLNARELLTTKPPFSAKVEVSHGHAAPGWDAPKLQDSLLTSLNRNSNEFFKGDIKFVGEGGSIPFMGMLSDLFPSAQFIVTGVLGPGSNAHGPNEFLDLEYAKKLTCFISHICFEHSTFCLDFVHTNTSDSRECIDRVAGAAEDKLVSSKK